MIHLFRHKYFYESFFYILIYGPKKINFSLLKYSYNTVTIAELVHSFASRAPKSHISMSYRGLPEVLQHALSVSKIKEEGEGKIYYHISKPKQGYDALSFRFADIVKITDENALDLIDLHEKKTLRGNFSHSKIKKILTEYSAPNMEGIKENYGARPGSVNEMSLKTFFSKDFNILEHILQQNSDLHSFQDLNVNSDDGSSFYSTIKRSPKGGHLVDGTTITDEGVTHLELLYKFLEDNEEFCVYINNLLDENPFFPL